MKTFLRILIICAILLILVFLSIGIVRVVPKALSSLASATVSLGSVFGGSPAATSTATVNMSPVGTTGFVTTATSTQSSGSTATSTGVSHKYNNYIPAPGSNTGAGNTYTSGSYSNTACTAGGSPNIAVTILSHGILNSYGQYVETNTFTTNDMVAVKFKVENRGACPTGAWSLRVQMPAQNSADQVRDLTGGTSLPAGAAVTGQANFSSPRSGSSSIVITATDASGRDSNISDNTASSALVVTTATGGYTGGYINQGTTGNFAVSGDGRPDLTVKIISVGILDYNNNFTPVSSQNFRVGSRIAVKFQVVNQGRSATGPWTFRAETNDMYQPRIYQDPQTENSIPSGGSSIYTVSFDNLSVGAHTMSLYTDSYNQVNEFDENNNMYGVNFYVNY